MQNYEETKAGKVGEDIEMYKLTPFQGGSKMHSTMTTELPWFYIERIETFWEYVVTLGHFHLRKYMMILTHQGCRFHMKAILELEINAFMTILDITNEKLGWKLIVLAHGLISIKFKKASYFNLGGEDHEISKEEGEFIYDIPNGKAMKAWC